MKTAFMMNRLDAINPVFETTSSIMYECNQRGHAVFFLESHDIYVRKQRVVARVKHLDIPTGLPMETYWEKAVQCILNAPKIFELITGMDALFLRKDPPLHYQAMEFLSPITDRLFMINSPEGMIKGNSKLYTMNFPDIIPETHVSRDPGRLKKIIDTFGGDMIMKPLGGFGGHGVIKVSTRDTDNLTSLVDYYVKSQRPYAEREAVMVQEYLPDVKVNGDVRILLLNGEILGAMGRKPPGKEFRTNVHAGGSVVPHTLTEKEKLICRTIAPRLIRDGLYFVGIDVIDGRLIEINCVSPGGIPRINALNNVKLEANVVDFVESKTNGRL